MKTKSIKRQESMKTLTFHSSGNSGSQSKPSDGEEIVSNDKKNCSKNKSNYKFITKLQEILNTKDNHDIISWSDDGKNVEIKDERRFIDEVLSVYFKHNSMSNFIRQLNMYNFKKIKNYRNSNIAYNNPYFVRNGSSLLGEINRKNIQHHHMKKSSRKKDSQESEEDSKAQNANNGSSTQNKSSILNDEIVIRRLNFLFKKLFDLEQKIKSLESSNITLTENNNKFSDDITNKTYYIERLESLIFFIVHHIIPKLTEKQSNHRKLHSADYEGADENKSNLYGNRNFTFDEEDYKITNEMVLSNYSPSQKHFEKKRDEEGNFQSEIDSLHKHVNKDLEDKEFSFPKTRLKLNKMKEKTDYKAFIEEDSKNKHNFLGKKHKKDIVENNCDEKEKDEKLSDGHLSDSDEEFFQSLMKKYKIYVEERKKSNSKPFKIEISKPLPVIKSFDSSKEVKNEFEDDIDDFDYEKSKHKIDTEVLKLLSNVSPNIDYKDEELKGFDGNINNLLERLSSSKDLKKDLNDKYSKDKDTKDEIISSNDNNEPAFEVFKNNSFNSTFKIQENLNNNYSKMNSFQSTSSNFLGINNPNILKLNPYSLSNNPFLSFNNGKNLKSSYNYSTFPVNSEDTKENKKPNSNRKASSESLSDSYFNKSPSHV